MPIPKPPPEHVIADGWAQLPGFYAWTRGLTEKWFRQWCIELDGRAYAVTRNGSGDYQGGDRLLFPTPLAAMMWVELEISNGP